MGINLRAANHNDHACLQQLEQAVIEAERPLNNTIKTNNARYYDIEKLISDDQSLLLVAEQDEQIIATGYVQVRESKQQLSHLHHGYLGFMYVAKEFRGQGMNQIIMNKLIDWAKETHNIQDFYLDVYSNNQAAIRAYEKLGFAPCLLEMKLHL